MQSSRKVIVTLLLGIFIVTTAAWAETTARIAQPVDSRRMTTLRGNVHPMARPEFDQGALDPSQMLHRVTIFFNRSAAQQQALDKLVEEQQDPSSANYHNWLTPEQFAAQFGLADADLAKIKDWLSSQGFTIDEVSRGHAYIAFSGSVGQIATALHTELHQYNVNGELHFANATAPAIPSALTDVVAGIRSLNDFKPKARAVSRRVKPNFTSALSGNHYMAPDDFASIYNLNALYSSGIDGTGQKIAVMGQTDINLSDIATFRSVSGLPANVPQVVLAAGSADPGTSSGDLGEADLDIEWAGAVAKKATIIYVNSTDAFGSLAFAISNETAPVISISYGVCEPDEISQGFLSGDEGMLQQASSQGQTIVGPSGDDGAADCDFPQTATAPPINSAIHGLAVDFPASSPFVTGVGGSAFNEGSGTFWNSTNNNLNGSALFYIPEVVWNDTAASVAAAQGFASTGGGVSSTFVKPTWQVGTGVPADGFRDVPDIALNASPGHDGFVTCSGGDCQICVAGDANCATPNVSVGYRLSSDQTLDISGGTSAGVPTFAGIVALINQKVGSSQGNVNPRLYALAASAPYVVHDITSGDNKVPCTSGTKDCPTGGNIGYTAGTGYDQTTGLGSVDGFNLVTNWNASPTADFGVQFFNSTITVTHGTSATIPITVRRQNGFNGTVTLACSSVLTGVTCSVSPGTINPDGVATVTITASATASLRAPGSGGPLVPWWTSAFGVAALFGMGKKRSKRQMIFLALLALALVAGLASCGGGSSSSTSGGTTGGTTGGTSGNVTLQATSGSLTHSTQITVTVN